MAGISLGTNVLSLAAQRGINDASAALSTSYTRLSSGQRINRASDDAAGLAIATQLNSKGRVYAQGVRNVNDGLSAASIAEGALGSLRDISHRQLELAEQAANGTYSLAQRQVLNLEANKLVDEFNRVVQAVSFNGIGLLDPNLSSVIVQAGYGTAESLSMGLSDKLRRGVGDGTFAVGATVNGYFYDAPAALAVGDFNGDGKLDFVESDFGYAAYGAAIVLGNGNGTFKAPTIQQVPVNGPTHAVTMGDFNGDGKADIAVAVTDLGYLGAAVSVLFGDGDSGIQSTTTVVIGAGTGAEAHDVTTGDFNGDGKTDLLVAVYNYTGAQPTILLGRGNGTFQAAQSVSFNNPVSVATGDFNGDGKTDFATVGGGGGAVFLGNGNGSFQAGRTFNATNGSAVEVGDFDMNGTADLLVTNGGFGVNVYLGNGNGTFQAGTSYAPAGNSVAAAIGDFNGDGRPDFAIANLLNITTFLGNGNGTFQAARTLATGGTPSALALGDFNGDNRLDIVSNPDTAYPWEVQVYNGSGSYASTSPYLNINTVQGAREALGTVQANLDRVAAQLGSIGATTSRLQVALSNLTSSGEQSFAAAGRIMDADIASDSSTLVRKQILQQAAAAVLGQANQAPRIALQLLQI